MQRLHWTVESPFEVEGVGVHTGEPARVRVAPARFGTGLRFRRWEAAPSSGEAAPSPQVPALVAHARSGGGCTVLARDGLEVRTPEHLLAALYGCGITDADIALDGPEVPILDGSAHLWCLRLEAAGRRSGPRLAPIRLRRSVRVELGDAWAEAHPHDGEVLRVEVDYAGGPSGVAEVLLDPDTFREDVAWARTFALERDIEALRAAGRGRGATLENTVIYGADGPVNEVRGFDEPVRHKLLDAIGDLALAGAPVQARLVVHRGSHALHHRLVAAILEARDPRAAW